MTSNPRLASALLAALTVALALPAAAQGQPDPVDRSRLPSLTPAVFESRGTVSVELPVVNRQPLSGFGPPPRTYVVPADRQAITRPFDPDLDWLPALAFAPPPEPVGDDLTLRRLRAEAGGGAQSGRYGRLDLSGVGASGEFFVDADYDGADGGSDRVRFDRLDVRAGGRSFGRGRLRLEGFASLDGYATPASIVTARRQRRSLGAQAGVEGLGAVPYALTIGFEQGQLSRTNDAEPESNEGRVDANARAALFQDRLRADVAGGLAGSGGFGNDVQYGAAGLAVALGRADGARLVLGARVLGYSASASAGGGDGQLVGPIVDVQVPLGANRLFATNDPHLAVRSLYDLTADNPFVLPDPIVVPDVVPVDARVGIELRPGAARVRGYGLAMVAPTYLAFERAGGAFSETYVDASAYGIGGDLTVAAASGATASAGLELRRGTSDGGDIPFFAPAVARAGFQVPVAGGRGRVGLSARGESARPADRAGLEDAGAWAVLALDARYDVRGPFSVVLRGERLVGEAERWPGSPEPPFTVMLGLRLSR